ncbi:RNA polymerase sigma factor [Streptomyces sp. NPDC059063]|uniref:RNA polymerase sigma factor n=1 Tax=unclassified Streptomyces TaxID=2593676 RepID=UPI00367DAA9B
MRHPDAVLIERSLVEPELFAEVYDRRAPEVYRYALRRLGEDLADDVVAETFVKAFRSRHRYDPDRCGARPWLYGIAGRVIAKHWRVEVRQYRTPTAPHGACRSWQAAALGGLPRRQREVLLLIAWEGLSVQEVAHALRIPVRRVQLAEDRARSRIAGACDRMVGEAA